MKQSRPYQIEAVNAVFNNMGKGIDKNLLVLATGCHAYDTEVIMYDGSLKKVQDVVVGDFLMGDDSTPRRVLRLFRGKETMYKITPKKGSPFVVNENHILSLKRTTINTKKSNIHKDIENVTVKEYLLWNKYKKHLYKLYKRPITHFENIGSPTHPYFMGLWLGDGTITSTQVTNPDKEIEEWLYGEFREFCSWNHPDTKITKFTPKNRCVNYTFARNGGGVENSIYKACKTMISADKEKQIPDRILRNCTEIRLEFLAGLLDSDGYLGEDFCTYEITTKYSKLADQIVFLCRSLGLAAYKKTKISQIKSINYEGTYYRINISGNTDIIPCKIHRKKAKKRLQKKNHLVVGFSVEKLDQDDYYGFELTSNRLYLTSDFFVHHNSGKTYISTKISERFDRTLFIVDREELMEQAALAFIREKFDLNFSKHVEQTGFLNYIKNPHYFAGQQFKMGAIKADVFDPKGNVVVASIQTLYRRLDKLSPEMFDCVIVDEAHKFMAKTYFTGVNFFKPKLRLGLTATPTRSDGLPLGDLFDDIAYEYNIKEGIRDGYLVELDAIRVKTTTSLDSVRTTAGDFNQKDLSNEINTLARNNLVAESYLKYAKGRRAIVFCCDIQHAMDLCDAFLSKGIKATAVSSNEEITGDRSQKVKDFKAGKYDAIMNVDILTTGFDDPEVSCIIQGAPTKSLTRYMQGIGRGTRTLPGTIDGITEVVDRWRAIKSSKKKDCIVIDIVDNTNRHSIVNSWELDRELPPEERTFITEEKRDKLLSERAKNAAKLEHVRKEDERVNLLKIPRAKVNLNSENMKKPATQPQLDWIKKLGYDIENEHYTNGMCQEIINREPLSARRTAEIKALGYDVTSRRLTNADYNAVMKEIWIKKKKKEEEEKRKNRRY